MYFEFIKNTRIAMILVPLNKTKEKPLINHSLEAKAKPAMIGR